MPTPNNPDFSLASKKRIANVVRAVEGTARNNGNVKRPFDTGGGGGGIPEPQYEYQVAQAVSQRKWGWALGPIAHPKIT